VDQADVVDQVAVRDGVTSSEETPPSCTLCVYLLHTHMTQQQKRNLKKLQVNEVDEVTRRTTCAMSRSEPRVPRRAATSVAGVGIGRSVARGLGVGKGVAGRVTCARRRTRSSGAAPWWRCRRTARRTRSRRGHRDLAHLQAFALRPVPQIPVNFIVIALRNQRCEPAPRERIGAADAGVGIVQSDVSRGKSASSTTGHAEITGSRTRDATSAAGATDVARSAGEGMMMLIFKGSYYECHHFPCRCHPPATESPGAAVRSARRRR
jgi:hypothetical protein